MKAALNAKIIIMTMVGAMLCTGCATHRDHKKSRYDNERKKQKNEKREKQPQPYEWDDATHPEGTYHYDNW